MGKRAIAGDGQPRSEKRQMTQVVSVRLLPNQKSRLNTLSAISGRSIQDLFRSVADADLSSLSEHVNSTAIAQLARTNHLLARIHADLTKLTQLIEADGQHVPAESLSQLIEGIGITVQEAGNKIKLLCANRK